MTLTPSVQISLLLKNDVSETNSTTFKGHASRLCLYVYKIQTSPAAALCVENAALVLLAKDNMKNWDKWPDEFKQINVTGTRVILGHQRVTSSLSLKEERASWFRACSHFFIFLHAQLKPKRHRTVLISMRRSWFDLTRRLCAKEVCKNNKSDDNESVGLVSSIWLRRIWFVICAYCSLKWN